MTFEETMTYELQIRQGMAEKHGPDTTFTMIHDHPRHGSDQIQSLRLFAIYSPSMRLQRQIITNRV
ncbi:hypothetical protein V1478_004650 [Vespula squamosa]|uniref:Uncharacterized protein n=1 Tax=Vespula squamosa TaxID=30214 RepID=A0ABD2BGT6_VESSQ